MAETYYVATDGNDDTGDGSMGSPWLSWDKPVSVLEAGDTVYIRGGTYTSLESRWHTNARVFCLLQDLIGTSDNRIYIGAYPGEKPVWDFTGLAVTNTKIIFWLYNSDYLHIYGLRLINAPQIPNAGVGAGFYLWQSSHNIIENCSIENHGGYGFMLHGLRWVEHDSTATKKSKHNVFLNCDARLCEDPYSGTPYGGADGFAVNWNKNTDSTYFIGCRGWQNGDDGWDLFNNENNHIFFDNCWAFWNGYNESFEETGDGVGFKLGPQVNDNSTKHLYTMTRCVAAGNRNTGFDQNTIENTSIMHFYNCLSYQNYFGWYFYEAGEEAPNVLRNNIAYGNVGKDIGDFMNGYTNDHNSWNGEVTVSGDDFISLDIAQLAGPRKANGDLPDVTFGKLVEGSDMINAGIDVGLPFSGSAPDLGAFDFDPAASEEYIVRPVFNVLVFPNPAHEYFSVVIEGELKKDLHVRFYNVLGKVMYEHTLQSNFNQIPIVVPSGLYMLEIITDDGNLHTQSLVVR